MTRMWRTVNEPVLPVTKVMIAPTIEGATRHTELVECPFSGARGALYQTDDLQFL